MIHVRKFVVLLLFLACSCGGPAPGSVNASHYFRTDATKLSRDLRLAAGTIDLWSCMFFVTPKFDLTLNADPVTTNASQKRRVGLATRYGEYQSITVYTELINKKGYAASFKNIMLHEMIHLATGENEHDLDENSIFHATVKPNQTITSALYQKLAPIAGGKNSPEDCGYAN